jgi:hypothetical protein
LYDHVDLLLNTRVQLAQELRLRPQYCRPLAKAGITCTGSRKEEAVRSQVEGGRAER